MLHRDFVPSLKEHEGRDMNGIEKLRSASPASATVDDRRALV